MTDRQQTADLLRLVLNVSRLLGKKRTASNADDLLLVAGVAVGQAEGKPMKAGKGALYVGMPRATTIRKLRELEARGVVRVLPGGQYVLGSALDSEKATEAMQAAVARGGYRQAQ